MASIEETYENTKEAVTGPSAKTIFGTLSSEVNNAIENADKDFGSIWNPLTSSLTRGDGTSRTITSSLDDYDIATKANQKSLQDNRTASDKVNNFLNPMGNYQDRQTAQSVRGSAGNALDSSATEEAIASGVASNAMSRYNDAYNQAVSNANTNIGIANASQGISEQMLGNDTTPQSDLIKYQSDWNTDKLQSAVDIAKAKAKMAAADGGFTGALADFFTTIK